MTEISQAYLRTLLSYDAETGVLVWRRRPESMFDSPRAAMLWNAKMAGKQAGCVKGNGYVQVYVNNRPHYAHRLIWILEHGDIPMQIDHINGNGLDNRLQNLRSVSPAENARNSRIRSDNKTGVLGVFWHDARQKYRAEIRVNGVNKHLGHYATLEEAKKARKMASKKYGFHDNHGRAA